jgi:hypothetical protein
MTEKPAPKQCPEAAAKKPWQRNPAARKIATPASEGRMTICRFIRLIDRLLRHLERTSRRIDALLAENAEREARLSRITTLLDALENRDRPN